MISSSKLKFRFLTDNLKLTPETWSLNPYFEFNAEINNNKTRNSVFELEISTFNFCVLVLNSDLQLCVHDSVFEVEI